MAFLRAQRGGNLREQDLGCRVGGEEQSIPLASLSFLSKVGQKVQKGNRIQHAQTHDFPKCKSYKPLVLKHEYSLKQTFGQAGTVRQASQVLHRYMLMIIIIIIAVMSSRIP
jgi:hypothetical protein